MIRGGAQICFALLVLAGCSGSGRDNFPMDLARESLSGGGETEFVPRFIRLLQTEAPALQVAFIDKETNSTLLRESGRAGIETWLSADGASLTFEQGLLHGTRGIGAGLLASELSEPISLVLGGREGASDRLMTYLDGEDRAVTRTFRCAVRAEGPRTLRFQGQVISTRLMSESCRSLTGSFDNLYWVGIQGNEVVQTRQWVSQNIGEISTRVVLQ